MYRFQFSRVSFTKASKYVFLVTTDNQTKRTDVCTLWTSSPQFQQNVQISSNQSYKIKACQATIDRKLKIIGQTEINNKSFKQKQLSGNILLFENDLQLYQVIQGRDILVGRFHLQVYKCQQNSKSQHDKSKGNSLKNSTVSNNNNLNNSNINNNNLNNSNINNNNLNNSNLNNSKVSNTNKINTIDNNNINQYNSNVQSARSNIHNNIQTNSARSNNNNNNYNINNNNKIPSNPQSYKNSQVSGQYKQDNIEEIDSDEFQLKSQNNSEQQLQNDCSIKFYIHGGNNFYLGSSFAVQLVWCQKYCQSKFIKDKIVPQWAQSLTLLGNSQKKITINILDDKQNILQWTKISLKNIRKMYPYHLKIIFRQQYMGDRPSIYITMMRQDLPMYSILDKQVRLILSYAAQNIRSPLQYLIIQSKFALQLPKFFIIDLRKYSTFEQLNKYIQSFQIGDYNWIDFIPLQNGKKSLVLFKSQLNRQLNLFLISIKNWVDLFYTDNQNLSSQEQSKNRIKAIHIAEKRQSFEKILRQIYYHDEVHAVGKITQIYSEKSLQQGNLKDTNTWRTLTKNYILRNNLLNTSIKNIQILKSQIANKGQQLTKLKKILIQVKSINSILKQKQKSTLLNVNKLKKQKFNIQNIKVAQIQMMLYQKQAQLQFKKKRNDQMNIRMQALNFIQEDTRELDQQIVKNAKTLKQQQQKIKLLTLMRKQIPKQKMLISKLQSIFQKKQLDKQMNQLLKKQSQTLEKIKKNKRADLQKVYALLKQKNNKQGSLKIKVQAAQKQLIRLNEAYAKLTGL